MSCYTPKPVYFKISGRPEMLPHYDNEKWNKNWKTQGKIPCRNCIGCKTDNTKEWGIRGTLEAKKYKDNYFVTLTYNNENLPINENGTPTLNKLDLKKFINSLKKHFNRKGHNGIKYIAASEYGGKKLRPHYHIIFFNLPLTDIKKTKIKNYNKEKKVEYSELIEKLWAKNTSSVSPNIIIKANYETIRYCVAYSFKKLKKTETKKLKIEPERTNFSKGIGLWYFENNKEQIYKNDSITIATGKKLMTTKPPKYYDRLMKKENEQFIKELKIKRQEIALKQTETELAALNISWIELMALKQKNLYSKIKKLKQPLKNAL